MSAPTPDLPTSDPNAPPPLLGTWPRVYVAVIASQVVFVLLLVAFVEVCA